MSSPNELCLHPVTTVALMTLGLELKSPLASSAVMVRVYWGAVPSILSACTEMTPESRSTLNRARGLSGICPTKR